MNRDSSLLPRFDQIGVIRCAALEVADVPSEGLPSSVVIDSRYRSAIDGIEVGDHLYVVAVFHLADPTVLTASPDTVNAQGAFSIRGSSRPNLIGLTLSKVVAIEGTEVSFEWLDFVDGTPVLDLKRYNWRWECVPSARRLDRRFIEQQIDRESLATVLARPAYNFHGERCQRVTQVGALGAALVQDHGVWLGSPTLSIAVTGDGHLIDCVQGLTGATLGSGRLHVTIDDSCVPTVAFIDGPVIFTATLIDGLWHIAM